MHNKRHTGFSHTLASLYSFGLTIQALTSLPKKVSLESHLLAPNEETASELPNELKLT